MMQRKNRTIIEQADFSWPYHVTVRLGVGEFDGNEKLDEFVKRVDSYQYEAKHRGKNNTCRNS